MNLPTEARLFDFINLLVLRPQQLGSALQSSSGPMVKPIHSGPKSRFHGVVACPFSCDERLINRVTTFDRRMRRLEPDDLSSATELFDFDESYHLWNRIGNEVDQLHVHHEFEQVSRYHRNRLEVLAIGKHLQRCDVGDTAVIDELKAFLALGR